MNIAYFRKSANSLEKTLANVKTEAKKAGWSILGSASLKDKGEMVVICRPEWVDTVLAGDHNLLGFLPCSVSVFEKDGNVMIGTGQPAIIKALTQNRDITEVAAQAETAVKELIHAAAGVTELKPTGVKLYSTTTCPYCKMESTWLEEKGVKHDTTYVDLNQEEARKMVERTGQMGVPVTEVIFDGGESEFVVGFDKPKLSALLGVQE